MTKNEQFKALYDVWSKAEATRETPRKMSSEPMTAQQRQETMQALQGVMEQAPYYRDLAFVRAQQEVEGVIIRTEHFYSEDLFGTTKPDCSQQAYRYRTDWLLGAVLASTTPESEDAARANFLMGYYNMRMSLMEQYSWYGHRQAAPQYRQAAKQSFIAAAQHPAMATKMLVDLKNNQVPDRYPYSSRKLEYLVCGMVIEAVLDNTALSPEIRAKAAGLAKEREDYLEAQYRATWKGKLATAFGSVKKAFGTVFSRLLPAKPDISVS